MTKPVSGKGSKASGGKSEKKKGSGTKKTSDGGKLSKVQLLRCTLIPRCFLIFRSLETLFKETLFY